MKKIAIAIAICLLEAASLNAMNPITSATNRIQGGDFAGARLSLCTYVRQGNGGHVTPEIADLLARINGACEHMADVYHQHTTAAHTTVVVPGQHMTDLTPSQLTLENFGLKIVDMIRKGLTLEARASVVSQLETARSMGRMDRVAYYQHTLDVLDRTIEIGKAL